MKASARNVFDQIYFELQRLNDDLPVVDTPSIKRECASQAELANTPMPNLDRIISYRDLSPRKVRIKTAFPQDGSPDKGCLLELIDSHSRSETKQARLMTPSPIVSRTPRPKQTKIID